MRAQEGRGSRVVGPRHAPGGPQREWVEFLDDELLAAVVVLVLSRVVSRVIGALRVAGPSGRAKPPRRVQTRGPRVGAERPEARTVLCPCRCLCCVRP